MHLLLHCLALVNRFKCFLHCFGNIDLIKGSEKCSFGMKDSVEYQEVCDCMRKKFNTCATRFLNGKWNISLREIFG